MKTMPEQPSGRFDASEIYRTIRWLPLKNVPAIIKNTHLLVEKWMPSDFPVVESI